jgi:hypothetical protein
VPFAGRVQAVMSVWGQTEPLRRTRREDAAGSPGDPRAAPMRQQLDGSVAPWGRSLLSSALDTGDLAIEIEDRHDSGPFDGVELRGHAQLMHERFDEKIAVYAAVAGVQLVEEILSKDQMNRDARPRLAGGAIRREEDVLASGEGSQVFETGTDGGAERVGQFGDGEAGGAVGPIDRANKVAGEGGNAPAGA